MEESGLSRTRELLEAISRFDRAYHIKAHRVMGQANKPGQAFLLSMIGKQGSCGDAGLRVSDIACRLNVTASNVTQMVTDLEDKGLVERKMDESDRRAVKVSLTPKGRTFLEEMRKPFIQSMEGLVSRLGGEKTATLIGLLAEVENFLMEQDKERKEQ